MSNTQASNADQNKVIAIIGYIFPFLFFIPLLTEAKNDKYAKFHANQQLNLLLFWVVGQVVSTVLYVVIIGVLLQLAVWVVGLVLTIIGVMNASKMELKPLPLIGNFNLLK